MTESGAVYKCADWHDFNRQYEHFRQLLISLPEGAVVIDDVFCNPMDDKGADFWVKKF